MRVQIITSHVTFKTFRDRSETYVSVVCPKINKVIPVSIALVLRVVFFCCDEESLKAFFLHTVFSSLGRNFWVQWRESQPFQYHDSTTQHSEDYFLYFGLRLGAFHNYVVQMLSNFDHIPPSCVDSWGHFTYILPTYHFPRDQLHGHSTDPLLSTYLVQYLFLSTQLLNALLIHLQKITAKHFG